MSEELGRLVRTAIRGWPETFRLCVLVVVVAATATASFYLVKSAVLPLFMK